MAQIVAGEFRLPHVVALQPPTEAVARLSFRAFGAWVDGWAQYIGPGRVDWVTRNWPSLGVQRIPTHVTFGDVASLAEVLGREERAAWLRMQARSDELGRRWPRARSAASRMADWLMGAPDVDFRTVIRVVEWLATNDSSGMYLRQIPVPGVHTKWIEANTRAVAALLAAATSRSYAPLVDLAGVRSERPRKRLRLLDPALRRQLGGLEDVTLNLDEFSTLNVTPAVALFIENKQTFLALEPLPSTVAVFAEGCAAPIAAAAPWVQAARVIYWGDIDLAGFQILSAVRLVAPHAESCLMDEETLLKHHEQWSHDEEAQDRQLTKLTSAEASVYAGLSACRWGTGVRLEQERIGWDYASSMLSALIGAGDG